MGAGGDDVDKDGKPVNHTTRNVFIAVGAVAVIATAIGILIFVVGKKERKRAYREQV
jgi:high-affinity Fe2+/Pb2+ permease